MSETNPRAYFVVPLDVEMLVTGETTFFSHPLHVGGLDGTVHFPGSSSDNTPVIVGPNGFERGSQSWGSWTIQSPDSEGQFGVAALGFMFDLPASAVGIPADELGSGYAKGFDEFEEELLDWVGRFTEWAQVVVRQPLSPLDPTPKLLSRANSGSYRWVEMGGESSWADSSPPALTIVVETTLTPLSERPANTGSLQRIVELADQEHSPGPAAISLVASARLAAQRGRYRLALMELGTAAEALFSDVLTLGTHTMTLGVLVDHVQTKGIALPPSTKPDFVVPRNDAVHKGQAPSFATLTFAFDLLDDLIALHYPDYACDPSLPLGFRTQRQDLLIIRPPQQNG